MNDHSFLAIRYLVLTKSIYHNNFLTVGCKMSCGRGTFVCFVRRCCVGWCGPLSGSPIHFEVLSASSKSHSVHGVWPRNVELKWFPKLQFKMEERELAAQLLS